MANRITGSTDTTGAISVRPRSEKSLLLVCSKAEGASANANTIYNITGTADANTKFGETASKLVKVLINNGVDNIKCIAVGSGDDVYGEALKVSLTDSSIKVVILDTTESEAIIALKTHLASAESEDMFRYGVIGLTATSVDDAVTEVASINDKRIFAPYPNMVDANNTTLNGIYTAAGLASAIMTETSDPAMPMNGVEIVGFGGTEFPLLKADKTALEQGGITAIIGNGTPSIWRLVTTRTKDGDNADPIWHEGTTLFVADDVLETVISTLYATYKRTKNTARILDSIRTTIIDILETKESFEIIENFDKNTVSVIKDPEDTYGALVDYEFDVVTPLYTITITQHMKL
jgi:phage tail sheath gpL-like